MCVMCVLQNIQPLQHEVTEALLWELCPSQEFSSYTHDFHPKNPFGPGRELELGDQW